MSNGPDYQRIVRGITGALFQGASDPPLKRARNRWGLDFPLVVDAILAFFLFLFTFQNAVYQDQTRPSGFLLLTLASTAPLALRRYWPLASWRFLLLGTFAAEMMISQHRPEVAWGPGTALVLSLYSVALRCRPEITFGAWLITAAACVPLTSSGEAALVAVMLATVPMLLGYNIRIRRQAQRDLKAEEARGVEEKAKRGVLEERARIARELHDVVAHHMSVIAIQAEAAPYLAQELPKPITDAFAEIRTTALDALSETRRMLGVLRSEGDTGETAPQPDLNRLDDLIATSRTAGVKVDVTESGERRPLRSSVGLSAYRIVQEGLANAMRHAPGAAVTVDLSYLEDGLRIRVHNGPPTDPGTAFALPPGEGHGLVGMRERAAMLGGVLSTGPTTEGGYVVVATLPYGGES